MLGRLAFVTHILGLSSVQVLIGELGVTRIRPTSDTIWDVVARWSEEYPPAIQTGSASDDDRVLAPGWEASTAAWDAWLGAVDHLEALGDLLEKVRVVHTFAPWSLLRNAMENSSLSIWLLQPDSAEERLTRRLRVAWADWGDVVEVQKRLAPENTGDAASAFRDGIKTLAREHDLDLSVVCGRWSWATVIREAATAADIATPTSAEYMWRLCSGFAHAREWARLAWLNVETTKPDADGQVGVDLSVEGSRLYPVLFLSFDLASAARRQIDRRRLLWRES